MERGAQGDFRIISQGDEEVRAFIPKPLPPEPPIHFSTSLHKSYSDALVALGRLDTVGALLPSPDRFIFAYLGKEALLSSMIDGTQSSLSELFQFEASDGEYLANKTDVGEVSNYLTAINHGVNRLKEEFPLSLRLIREMHARLLATGRGSDGATPGEFRRSQNWIGGTRPGNAAFVPPPASHLIDAMGALEKYWHDDPIPSPPLIKAALSHAQFETIHPFLDGNGRLGRMLITLILYEQKVLRQPLLYLSLYFKKHRQEYYQHLMAVRTNDRWEDWMEFFCVAVIETAKEAIQTVGNITHLLDEDRSRLDGLGRQAASAARVLEGFSRHPVASVAEIAKLAGVSAVTTGKCISEMEKIGILEEITGRGRRRLFRYGRYIETLEGDMHSAIVAP